jgi:two-component system sensor histidine kinase KdpD
LRTPLAVVTGASSSLLESDESLDPQTRRELYLTIYEEGRRLSRLVDNLLDMTRIESGGVKVNKAWHVIEEVIGSALHRMADSLEARPVATHLPADLTLAPMDDALIEQVLINLLENVQKYTPAGSPVELTARREERQIVIEVADRGPGLSPGEEQHVFEKFYRGRAASDGRPGAGLGLAICRAIVVAHGGRSWAQNRPEGGVRFCFSLPLEGRPPPVVEPEAVEAATSQSER